jgi:hypothetical protein
MAIEPPLFFSGNPNLDPLRFINQSDQSNLSVLASNILSDSRKAEDIKDLKTHYIKTYKSVICYLEHPDPKESLEKLQKKQAILNRLESLTNKEENIYLLNQAADSHEWVKLDTVKDYPPYALAAIKDGLPIETFTTIIFYWTLRQKSRDIQSVPLFQKEGTNPVAEDLIRQSLVPTKNGHLTKLYQLNDPYLNEEQLSNFFKLMSEMPLSEQQFFLIPDESRPGSFNEEEMLKDILTEKRTIIDEIKISNSINIFLHVVLDGKPMRMFPSFGMMQAFLKALSKDNYVTITPVIDLSSLDGLRQNGLTNTRDMALPFSGISLPKKADDVIVLEDIDFIYHDFYHAIIASFVFSLHRKAGIKLDGFAQALKNHYSLNETKVHEYLDMVSERLIDMEYVAYRPELGIGKEAELDKVSKTSIIFWRNLQTIVGAANLRLALQHAKGSLEDLQEYLQMTQLLIAEKEIFSKLFNRLFENKKEFKEMYKIKFKPLLELGEETKKIIKKQLHFLKEAHEELYEINRHVAYQNNALIQGLIAYQEYKRKQRIIKNKS